MDFDSRRARTVLFGGYDGNNNLSDTWEWNGAAWSSFSPVPAPPAAVGQQMVYDSTRGVSVLLVNSSEDRAKAAPNSVTPGPTTAPTGRRGRLPARRRRD
jgi:hypothetical protein